MKSSWKMIKRIGIEAQGIFKRDKTKSDIAVLEFIKKLQHTGATDLEFIILVRPGQDVCLSSSKLVKVVELQSVTAVFWEQVVLPAAVQKHKLDILHCTSGTAPLDAGIPVILTFRDSDSSNWLARFYKSLVVSRVIKRAHTIITSSEADKAKLGESFGQTLNVITCDESDAEQMIRIYKDALN